MFELVFWVQQRLSLLIFDSAVQYTVYNPSVWPQSPLDYLFSTWTLDSFFFLNSESKASVGFSHPASKQSVVV